MVSFILFSLFSLMTSQIICEDLLAPECPKCLLCNPDATPSHLYIVFASTTLYNLPPRIGQYKTIREIYINQPVYNIPTEIGLLTNITTIKILKTVQVPGLPTELAALKKLTRLVLKNTNLITDFNSQMLSLTRLTYLELDNVSLNISVPTELFRTNLSYIKLKNTDIWGTVPDTTSMSKLTYMDLSYNKLSGTISGNIFSTNLINVMLANNMLSGYLPLFPDNIGWLDLGYNNLKGLIHPYMGKIGYLLLNNNNFTSLQLNPTKTYKLDVSYNSLSDAMPYSAALDYLDISYNKYSTIPNEIYFSTQLYTEGYLNVAGNRLDYGIVAQLMRKTLISMPQDVDECTLGTHFCSNMSICSDGWSPRMSYTCKCNIGFKTFGTACVDINECVEGNPCDYKLQCINTIGSFNCCISGYMAVGNECVDVNECVTNPVNLIHNCSNKLQCINAPGSFKCCDAGYMNVNDLCVDVNECQPNLLNLVNNCTNNYQCINTPGSFKCCALGYGNVDDKCVDINECILNQYNLVNDCLNDLMCINTPGSFKCCNAGYMAINGICVDVNECQTNQLNLRNNCVNDLMCINTIGSFKCCDAGYLAENDKCVDVNECQSNQLNLINNCTNNYQCINTNGSFKCCGNGYSNINDVCVDIDECTLNSYNLINNCTNNLMCINTNGSFKCCESGHMNSFGAPHALSSVIDEKCGDVNECQPNQLGLRDNCTNNYQCINTLGSFKCCDKGFRANYIRESYGSCVDINECYPNPFNVIHNCSNKLQCINTHGSFKCCSDGYMAGTLGDPELNAYDICVDVNECQANPLNLPNNCTHKLQCINTNGSFKCCNSGFMNVDDKCIDVNECQLNPLNLPNNCSNKLQCVNTEGGYKCCDTGYTNINNECIDINECLSDNSCSRIDSCVNTNGSYVCCPTNTYNKNPNLAYAKCLSCNATYTDVYLSNNSFNLSSNITFDYQRCAGTCDNGRRILITPILSEGCNVRGLIEEPCSYACKNLTEMNTPRSAIATLYNEFGRGNFLSDIITKLYNLNISMTTSFSNNYSTLIIVSSTVKRSTDSSLIPLLTQLAMEIVPNIPSFDITFDNNSYILSSTSNETTSSIIISNFNIIPIIVPIVIILIIISIIILYFVIRDPTNLSLLPDEVTWSYRMYYKFFSNWSYRGSNNTGYYYKQLLKHSNEYNKIIGLFNFSMYTVESITLVFNSTLLNNFIGNYAISSERFKLQPNLFAKKAWERSTDADIRQDIYKNFTDMTTRYEWNKNNAATRINPSLPHSVLPIIPTCHGTDLAVAEKICETGFANLSSLDQGYYGKGIYFTSYPEYCLSYMISRRQPAIIMSWVIPGNAYPVCEKHNDKNSLLGAALKAGYQSHYVVTNSKGEIANSEGRRFNEMVIPQESQIVPFAIVELDGSTMCELGVRWAKQTT